MHIKGTAEAQKRAASITVLLSSGGVALETDLATNGAMDTSVNIFIKLMILLWRSGFVDSFTAIQLILNGVFVVGSSVGQALDPSILAEPILQLCLFFLQF